MYRNVFQISSWCLSSFHEPEIDNFESDDKEPEWIADADEEVDGDDDDDDEYVIDVDGHVVDEENETDRRHMAHVSSIFLEASKALVDGELDLVRLF